MLSLGDVARLTGGSLVGDPAAAAVEISGAQTDSRRVRPGQLFVAYRGERLDGHDYAAQAVEAGAAALLVERPMDLPIPQVVAADPRAGLAALARGALEEQQLQLIVGITGSAGKTTTRTLVQRLLEASFPGTVLSSTGSYNTDTGLSMNILDGLRPGVERAVFELGCQRRGEIAGLCRIVRPNAGVVTSIGGAHLAFLGSLEGVAQAKGELVEALPSDGFVALNGDDPRVEALRYRTAAMPLLYGFGSGLDCVADDVRDLGPQGSRFRWRFRDASGNATLKLAGLHNVRNALAAIAVASMAGVCAEAIDATLPEIEPEHGRLELIPGPSQSWLLDDSYNASREAMEAALTVVSAWHGRRVALLGDMFELGDSAACEHQAVGRFAAGSVQVLGVIGNEAQRCADAAVSEGLPRDHVERFPCDPADAAALETARRDAATWLRALLEPGDLALIKASRGMGLEAVVQALRRPS